jgi:hypothetical protein
LEFCGSSRCLHKIYSLGYRNWMIMTYLKSYSGILFFYLIIIPFYIKSSEFSLTKLINEQRGAAIGIAVVAAACCGTYYYCNYENKLAKSPKKPYKKVPRLYAKKSDHEESIRIARIVDKANIVKNNINPIQYIMGINICPFKHIMDKKIKASKHTAAMNNINQVNRIMSRIIIPINLSNFLDIVNKKINSYSFSKITNSIDPFKYIMGITEKQFHELSYDDRERHIDRKSGCLVNIANKAKFPYGQLSLVSITELEKQIDNNKEKPIDNKKKDDEDEEEEDKNSSKDPIVFNVLSTRQKCTSHTSLSTNISTVQVRKTFKGALVQIASNFNCIEGGAIPVNMDRYCEKMAQGECAALGAMAAAIYRTYYTIHSDNKIVDNEPDQVKKAIKNPSVFSKIKQLFFNKKFFIGQQESQLNLLDRCCLSLHRGYLSKESYEKILKTNWNSKPNFYKQILVGIHSNIQPTFKNIIPISSGKMDAQIINEEKRSKSRIYQLLTATINKRKIIDYAMSEEGGRTKGKGYWEENLAYFTKGCLQAAYEGTFLAAIAHNKKTVILTLIGGGVFENNREWILEAIKNCLEKYKSYKLSVTLILYQESSYYSEALLGLVQHYNGKYEVNNAKIELIEKNGYEL